MFFSVSIPVYNAEQSLEKCIESVLRQTEADYELILVNDGSTDGSLNICEKYQKEYPNKIHVIDKENEGSLFTRRICLQESMGEYLYVIDADDYLLSENALLIIRKAIESRGCDMVFFEATTNGKNPYVDFPFENDTLFTEDNMWVIQKYYIERTGLNPLWSKVFHRSLVDWNADYSNFSEVTNGTDAFQTIPIISAAKKILYINDILYFYKTEQNQNSIVHKFRKTIYFSMKSNFLRLEEYSLDWNIPDKKRLLQVCCMKSISTAAYKARLITDKDGISKYEYLKTIGEDTLFNNYFRLEGLSLSRKIILILLKAKLYKILSILISLFGFL